MATSGTTSFALDFPELVEEAYARASGGAYEPRSGYDLRTARRSLNILLSEWANLGLNLWTVDTGTIALVPGTATYVLPADTVDIIDQVIRTGAGDVTNQTDITCSRISSSTYASIPNKLTQARPLQVWVQRLNTPQLTVWPVPDSSQTYTLVYWRMRRLQDAGNGDNTPDVPFRFLPALIAGLAYQIAMKIPQGMERLSFLKEQYNQAWQNASDEDRDRSTIRLVPRVGRM